MAKHPLLARLGALIGMRHPLVGAGIQMIAGQPLAPATPVGAMVATVPAPPAATAQVMATISSSPNVALTEVRPMWKSKEGWAIVGAGAVLLNSVMPQIGITLSQPVADAAEAIAMALGFRPGIGTAVVYLAALGALGFAWVRKKWFTHTITPAAADRAVANGTAV